MRDPKFKIDWIRFAVWSPIMIMAVAVALNAVMLMVAVLWTVVQFALPVLIAVMSFFPVFNVLM